MRCILAVVVCALIATFALSQTQTDKARKELDLGVSAYKQARYDSAVQHFRNAASLDPELLAARLYLATALAQQVIPGAETPENARFAQEAVGEFQKVLDSPRGDEEQKLSALKSIATLYFNTKQLEKAKEYNLMVTQVDPQDPEAYYSIGVIDWTQSYQPRMEKRAALGLKPNEPVSNPAVCEEIRAANQDKVKEGIEMLTKALELRPDYDDAMAYMNLMYRERADIQCGNPVARANDLKKADEWINLVFATRKKKSEQMQRQPK